MAALISASCFQFFYSDTESFGNLAMSSLLMGWISLPLSFLHLLILKGSGIIAIAGRPWLLLYYLAYWAVMLTLQIFYVKGGDKKLFMAFSLIAILSAPYSAYYFHALMGV